MIAILWRASCILIVIGVLISLGYLIKDERDRYLEMTPEQKELHEMGYEIVSIHGKRFIRNNNRNFRTYGQLTPFDSK